MGSTRWSWELGRSGVFRAPRGLQDSSKHWELGPFAGPSFDMVPGRRPVPRGSIAHVHGQRRSRQFRFTARAPLFTSYRAPLSLFPDLPGALSDPPPKRRANDYIGETKGLSRAPFIGPCKWFSTKHLNP